MVKRSKSFHYNLMGLGIVALLITVMVIMNAASKSFAQDATNTRTPTIEVTLFRPTVWQTGLPTLHIPSFTPSKTVVPSPTPTFTITPSPSPTLTVTSSPTPTITLSPTETASFTPEPSATETILPSDTPENPTETTLPIEAAVASQTLNPTSTATEAIASATIVDTATETESPTVTETPENTPIPSLTSSPTATETATSTSTVTSSPTSTETSTITLTPSITPTASQTSTPTITPTPAPPIIETTRPSDSNDSDQPISMLLLVLGGMVTLLVGGYMVSYSMNAAAMDRYGQGFVINQCPVCEVGHLELEERFNRILFIPRVKRTVRCDHCRSVLREVGKRKWRYAVDPAANPDLYRAMNNQVIHENELYNIAPDHETGTPQYIDE